MARTIILLSWALSAALLAPGAAAYDPERDHMEPEYQNFLDRRPSLQSKVKVSVANSGHDDCQFKANVGDQMIVRYKLYDSTSRDLVQSNVNAGTPDFRFIVGEEDVLAAFNEGMMGACPGQERHVHVPKELNDLKEGGRWGDKIGGKDIDFEVDVIMVVPRAARHAAEELGVALRSTSNVSEATVDEAVGLGVPVNLKDTNGRSLLTTASFTGNTDAVRALLRHGADPNAAMHTGMVPLIYAAGEGHTRIVQLLLEAGADVHKTLHVAGSPFQGYTALHFASLQGRIDAVMQLVDAGASAEARDAAGNTALDVARRVVRGGSHKGLHKKDRERLRRNFIFIKRYLEASASAPDQSGAEL